MKPFIYSPLPAIAISIANSLHYACGIKYQNFQYLNSRLIDRNFYGFADKSIQSTNFKYIKQKSP
jgi:hypothetical protein